MCRSRVRLRPESKHLVALVSFTIVISANNCRTAWVSNKEFKSQTFAELFDDSNICWFEAKIISASYQKSARHGQCSSHRRSSSRIDGTPLPRFMSCAHLLNVDFRKSYHNDSSTTEETVMLERKRRTYAMQYLSRFEEGQERERHPYGAEESNQEPIPNLERVRRPYAGGSAKENEPIREVHFLSHSTNTGPSAGKATRSFGSDGVEMHSSLNGPFTD